MADKRIDSIMGVIGKAFQEEYGGRVKNYDATPAMTGDLARTNAALSGMNKTFKSDDIQRMSSSMAQIFPDEDKVKNLLDQSNKLVAVANQVNAIKKVTNANDDQALKYRKDVLKVQQEYVASRKEELLATKVTGKKNRELWKTELARMDTLNDRLKSEEKVLQIVEKQLDKSKQLMKQQKALDLAKGKMSPGDFILGQIAQGKGFKETAGILKEAGKAKALGQTGYKLMGSLKERRAMQRERYGTIGSNLKSGNLKGAGGAALRSAGAIGLMVTAVIVGGAKIFTKIIGEAGSLFATGVVKVTKFLSKSFGGIQGTMEGIVDLMASSVKSLSGLLSGIGGPFSAFIGKVGDGLSKAIDAIGGLMIQVAMWNVQMRQTIAKYQQTQYGHTVRTGNAKGDVMGMAPNIRAPWISSLAQAGVVDKFNKTGIRKTQQYRNIPPKYRYALTHKADSVTKWGARWANFKNFRGDQSENIARNGVILAKGLNKAIGKIDINKLTKKQQQAMLKHGYAARYKVREGKRVKAGVRTDILGESRLDKFTRLSTGMGMDAGAGSNYLSQMRDVIIDADKALTNMETSFAVSQKLAKKTGLSTRVFSDAIAESAVQARYLKVDFNEVAGLAASLGKDKNLFTPFGLNKKADFGKTLKQMATIGSKWSDSQHAFFGSKMYKGLKGSPLTAMFASKYGKKTAMDLASKKWANVKGGKETDLLSRRMAAIGNLAWKASDGRTDAAGKQAQIMTFQKYLGKDFSIAGIKKIMTTMEKYNGDISKAMKDFSGLKLSEKDKIIMQGNNNPTYWLSKTHEVEQKSYEIQRLIAKLVGGLYQKIVRGDATSIGGMKDMTKALASGGFELSKKGINFLTKNQGVQHHAGGTHKFHSGGFTGLTGEEFNIQPFSNSGASSMQILSRGQLNAKEQRMNMNSTTSNSKVVNININGNAYGSAVKELADEISKHI